MINLSGQYIYPIGWLVYTLVRGAIVDWYPYPFLDVGLHGYPRALLACAAVAVLLLALTWAAIKLDPRLPGTRDDARRAASRQRTVSGRHTGT